MFFLGEPLTLRLLIASMAILGGIALVILTGDRRIKPAAPAPVSGGSHPKPP